MSFQNSVVWALWEKAAYGRSLSPSDLAAFRWRSSVTSIQRATCGNELRKSRMVAVFMVRLIGITEADASTFMGVPAREDEKSCGCTLAGIPLGSRGDSSCRCPS